MWGSWKLWLWCWYRRYWLLWSLRLLLHANFTPALHEAHFLTLEMSPRCQENSFRWLYGFCKVSSKEESWCSLSVRLHFLSLSFLSNQTAKCWVWPIGDLGVWWRNRADWYWLTVPLPPHRSYRQMTNGILYFISYIYTDILSKHLLSGYINQIKDQW